MSINRVFKEIGRIQTERSAFDLSFPHITTMDMGLLYPIMTKFTMPGDKWSIDVSAVARAIPLVYPSYIDVDMNIVSFFVPSRLLWDDFEEFITGNEDGEFNLKMPKFSCPTSNTDTLVFGDSVVTRLGLLPPLFPSSVAKLGSYYNSIPDELKPSVLPLRAYYFIWNEYFRDENLQDKIDFKSLTTSIGKPLTHEWSGLMRVAWLKDYFTSCLPFQQRGTSPSIPFEGQITADNLANSVIGRVSDVGVDVSAALGRYGSITNLVAIGTPGNNNIGLTGNVTGANFNGGTLTGSLKNSNVILNSDGIDTFNKFKVNISDSFNISELRTAFQIQKFLERNARAGVRYTEFLQAHYNVSPSDARLDRPEFIGGAKFPLAISDVFQTSPSTTQEPLGSYAGRALVGGSDSGTVDYFVEEYGYILTLAFMRPKTYYMQGIKREFQYISPFEYPLPEFMHLSERGITNSEIFISKNTQTAVETFNPTEIFGYQGIYDELRSSQGVISGLMAREDYRPWHLAQIYDAEPQLNSSFIECRPRADIFSITDTNNTAQFNVQFHFDIKCVRPMPIIGEPGLIDHF